MQEREKEGEKGKEGEKRKEGERKTRRNGESGCTKVP